jgi:hypothetical protein
MLKTDNAEISMNVSGDKVNDLPINFGGGGSVTGGIRSWLSFTYLSPGVAGTSANSEVNGLPGSNFKVYLEGQDSTSNNDAAWTSTQLMAGVEAITEFAVQSSNFSAEFGQVMGGVYNFTTKSGTNQLHGSAYEEWVNEALDARVPFNHLKNRDRKNDYGFTVGGPVWIPKIYNGKNHTFFFFNLERFGTTQTSLAQNGTLPTTAERGGDFSCLLYATTTNCTGPTVALTDPTSGYQYLEGQIFDPASTYTDAKGNVVRTPFPNNMIPMSRMDPVALKIQALIPAAIGSQTSNNWAPDIANYQRQQIPSFKIDQDFGPNTKANFYWSEQTNPQVAYPDGLPIPLTSARPKVVGGQQERFNLDRTLSADMLVHFGLGFYRFHNPDSSPESVLNYPVASSLGLVGTATGVGFPAISGLGGNINGLGPSTADHQTTDMGSATASWSWIHGKHTFKAGAEVKQDVYSDENLQGAQGVYAFSGAQTAIPFLNSQTISSPTASGSIGNGYASFLLGAVQSTTVNPPKDTQLRRITEALYFQDTFKLTSKLTLEIGVRWDRVPLGTELWNRQSEIGLDTPNPNAGNLPGGFIFAGYGPGRCNCEFSKTYNFGFAPRLSLAYQLNKNTVIRAGWGVVYSAGDSWAYLNGGYSLNGLGINSVSQSASSFGLVSSQFSSGIVYNPAQLTTQNLTPGVNTVAGQLNNFSSVWGGLYNDPEAGRPARINNWDIALQRQLTKDMSIEAAYVGNRGVWEPSNGLVALDAITPARLKALGLDLTNAATNGRLNCLTCHSPHSQLDQNASSYDVRCQTCHANKVHRQPVAGLACVTCHMPRIPDGPILSFANHRIAVYSPYAANLCPIRCGGAVSHTRRRTIIVYSEGRDCNRYFGKFDRQPREPRPDGASGASLGKTVRTKRRNEACPLDPECFVQLTTSRKHWPHINAKQSDFAGYHAGGAWSPGSSGAVLSLGGFLSKLIGTRILSPLPCRKGAS